MVEGDRIVDISHEVLRKDQGSHGGAVAGGVIFQLGRIHSGGDA